MGEAFWESESVDIPYPKLHRLRPVDLGATLLFVEGRTQSEAGLLPDKAHLDGGFPK